MQLLISFYVYRNFFNGCWDTLFPLRHPQYLVVLFYFYLLHFQYYMKTGECKFGDRCKFDHPIDRSAPTAKQAQQTVKLTLAGLPRREVQVGTMPLDFKCDIQIMCT